MSRVWYIASSRAASPSSNTIWLMRPENNGRPGGRRMPPVAVGLAWRGPTTRRSTRPEGSMPAKGTAEWKGDLRTGAGTFTAGDSISGGYTFKSRFEDGPGSNPEQLIAAAHAACFSMALSNMLAEAGHPVDSLRTDATVTLRPVDGSPTITKIRLVYRGRAPGNDEVGYSGHDTTD